MLPIILNFNKTIKDQNIMFTNNLFNRIIENYDFYYISDISNEPFQNIDLNIVDSKCIIIDQNEELNHEIGEKCCIIGFEKTIIIIKYNCLPFLFNLLSNNPHLFVYFLSNTKNIFNQALPNEYQEIDNSSYFNLEITNFNQFFCLKNHTKLMNQFFSFLKPCISGYLIKKSYYLLNVNRIEQFNSNQSNFLIFENLKENEYIELRIIGIGSEFKVILIYHIEKGQLFAIKKPHVNDMEIPKLINREIENYRKFNSPFLPKFYGLTKDKDSIIIEFIKGEILNNIESAKLNDKEKIFLIMQLILVIEHFHLHNYVYRDLKPNNVMIDENKTAVLIDLDRLIKVSENPDENIGTLDFFSIFTDPEILYEGKYSQKSDIFSLGMIMYYIINEKKANLNNLVKNDKMESLQIWDIFTRCIDKIPGNRPTIYEIINVFYNQFHLYFDDNKFYKESIQAALNNDAALYIRLLSLYNPNDAKKIIDYHLLLANQNDSNAQYFLGSIYYNGKFVPRDINKAIHYYTLAANLNNPEAQFQLGFIYDIGKYVKRDINKAIYYYTLAANQNNMLAQYNLGLIYEFSYIKDINKAIYFYILAANQNYLDAQINLGNIYIRGIGVPQDVEKAIYYFTLAAKQNDIESMNNLGYIYINFNGYIDINKAVYYFTCAANLNNDESQVRLGLMYMLGKNVPKDINKAMYYLSLAAKNNNQTAKTALNAIYQSEGMDNDENEIQFFIFEADKKNNQKAQYSLARIFLDNNNTLFDINKGIHYLTLAANQNYVEALNLFGYLYFNGIFLEKDINKSIHYFTLAANQNDCWSSYILGSIYISREYCKFYFSKAIHYFMIAANQNYAKAQYQLGNIYYYGRDIPRDIEKAIYYYSLAAKQNNSDALFQLGTIYGSGRFVLTDINKAIYYFTLASDQNNAKAQFNLGQIYLEKKDIEKSIYYYTLSANQDYPSAQNNLAQIYSMGKYVKRDIKQAIKYYTLAAKQNCEFALFNLGIIYSTGKGVPVDLDKAIHYFKLAVDRNCPYSNYNLGCCYIKKKDFKKATQCFLIESNKNNSNAQFNLGSIYASGSGGEYDIDKAIYYYTLAAKQNNYSACFSLGYIYSSPEYNKFDMNKAIYYYQISAKNNQPSAQLFLGIFYYYFTQNIDESLYLLTKASENGNVHSSFMLGSIYHIGEKIEKNISKAIYFYKKASSFNNNQAKNNLGVLYKNGYENEVPQNLGFAIEYFEEAIRQKNDFVSSYNLAHLYIYYLRCNENIDKSIDILINSLNQKEFRHSYILLCLALVLKYGADIKTIENEINEKSSNLSSYVCKLFSELNFNDKVTFDRYYKLYQTFEFVYDSSSNIVNSMSLNHKNDSQMNNQNNDISKNITFDFYNGFGIT